MNPIKPIAPGPDHLPPTEGPLTPMTKRELWWSGQLFDAKEEIVRLQSELAQAQACCAAKQNALEFIGGKTDHGHNDGPCPICLAVDEASIDTCGTALLEELRELREFKARYKKE